MRKCQSASVWGFSLIEIMLVITILSVLMAIILPNISRSRQQAILSSCESNERNLVAGLEVYNAQHKRYPSKIEDLYPYYMKRAVCPTNKSDYGYEVDAEAKTFTISCQGSHSYGVLDIADGYPKITPTSGLITKRKSDTQ